jgi:anti-anti-sigma regulatory factor
VFKVTAETADGGGVVLKLEGRLADACVDELARAIQAATNGAPQVTFDLDGLTFVDARGIALLRGAAQSDVQVIGGSAFITALLQLEREI